jgi:hypothetical protein
VTGAGVAVNIAGVVIAGLAVAVSLLSAAYAKDGE